MRAGHVDQPGRGQPERLAAAARPPAERDRGSSSASGVSSSGRAGSQPATTRVGRGGPSGRTGAAGAGPDGIATSPPAGRKPARIAESATSGSATKDSPTWASVTRAPSPPSGATGRAPTTGTGIPGPNSSSTVTPSALARARATRNDGSECPASTADTACRDTPAMPASCCWE